MTVELEIPAGKCEGCGAELSGLGIKLGKCLPCRAGATGEKIASQRYMGYCSRCKEQLVFDSFSGNCQPDSDYRFGPKPPRCGDGIRVIFNGAMFSAEILEVLLCDRCVFLTHQFLKGEK